MRTTIDTAGRVVIPKVIRDELGLLGGQEIEVIARDGQVVIEPAGTAVHLVEEKGLLVGKADEDLPPLTTEQVRDIIDRVRR